MGKLLSVKIALYFHTIHIIHPGKPSSLAHYP